MIPLLKDYPAYEVWEDDVLVYPVQETGQYPPPELPAEVWSHELFDADKAWKATMAMCKGERL